MGASTSTEHLYKRGRIWWCWYYDRTGTLVRASTGTTDKKAARDRLAEFERVALDPASENSPSLNDTLQALLLDRTDRTSAENVSFLTDKVRPLVTILGHDLSIAAITDSTLSWRYIDARRAMKVNDRTTMRELKILRRALAAQKARGKWAGDLDVIVPPDFDPAPADRGDVITRADAPGVFARLSPDSSAAMAFALATGAEMAVLRRVLRTDVPRDLATCTRLHLRGTKNEHRDAAIPVVTDEQRVLLAHAARHGRGKGARLFGELHRFDRELAEACEAEGITVVSPHDIRRSAGQWLVDLSVPLELVSKFMRHADVRTTERFYASVRREVVADRMLDAIDPRYAKVAHAKRSKKPLVATLKAVPEPRRVGAIYEVGGLGRTLTEWAVATGIPKATLHNRLANGKTMEEALALGRPAFKTGRAAARTAPTGATGQCERDVKGSTDSANQNGRKAPPVSGDALRFHRESSDFSARRTGLEPAASGVTGRRYNQLNYRRNFRDTVDKYPRADARGLTRW